MLSTTDSDRYYGNSGFKRVCQHLKMGHKVKLARKYDGTFQSDQENPFKRPRPTSKDEKEDGSNTNLSQVDVCAINGGDDHISVVKLIFKARPPSLAPPMVFSLSALQHSHRHKLNSFAQNSAERF
jgi:hypothetical protein